MSAPVDGLVAAHLLDILIDQLGLAGEDLGQALPEGIAAQK